MGRSHRESASVIERGRGPIEDPLTLPPGEQFLTKGFLLQHRRQLVASAVVLLVVASLLSYFIKPRAPMAELVNPEQELAGFAAQYPGDNSLAKRVTNSFSLAIVLIGSPYTATNVRALENVRSWAQDKFQSQPDFLHPVSIKQEQEPNDTIVGALGYNLFASIRYYLESAVGAFLRSRIADFHNDPAYQSFSNSYFEIYGKDAEAATLLAKFQSDRAKQSIDVILWTMAWTALSAFSLFSVAFSPRRQRFDRIRQSLVLTWLLIAVAYGGSAWMTNSIPSLVSALLSVACCGYFLKPFVLLTRTDASLKIVFIQLSSRWIAFSVWASYSMLAITVLTWIRCTLPASTDPVSLLLSGLNGNFLSDPEEGKRVIARVLGILWVAVSTWAFFQKDKDARISDELEAELASL